MLVNEILNKKVDYEVIRSSDRAFRTEAEIGGRMIQFSAECDDPANGFWELAFSETKDGKRTYAATGNGRELEVFSMVKDSILELISRYEPLRMFFTAEKVENGKETARSSLYARLFKKFKVPGYTVEIENIKMGAGNSDQFTITKDGYAD